MRLLQDRGYEVHAAACPADGHKEEVEAAGVTCWDIPFARSPYGLGNINACRKLGRLLRKCRYHLIHVHTPVASFIGRFLAKATGQRPVLYTAHGFHFYRGAPIKDWLLYYTAERLAARWTDGFIVMNGKDYENAQKMGFVPAKNLFLVHGVGVDLRRYNIRDFDHLAFKARFWLGSNDVVVTCVAELNHNKN
ncbi:MAG: glycosyltransferase [Desulfofundulus sp.]